MFQSGRPRLLPFGLGMIGPVLIKYGTQAQKDRFLSRIINVDDWWCQGYSEPGSGSDLASLKTRAERVGDRYIINGQKTWTTLAHYADWMFCLARTDPSAKAQRGISMILIDMRQPGVQVRPIKTLDGGAEVNEVWLENVEAPLENLIGEENNGWTYAKYLLGHERSGIAGIGHCHRELAILKSLAERTMASGESLSLNPRVRDSINRVEAQVLALEMMVLRVAADESSDPGPKASILKFEVQSFRWSWPSCKCKWQVLMPGLTTRSGCWQRPISMAPVRNIRLPLPPLTLICARRLFTAVPTRFRKALSPSKLLGSRIHHGFFILRRATDVD